MFTFLNTSISPHNYNLFECLTAEHEYRVWEEQQIPLVDFFIETEFPRFDVKADNPFPFVYGLFIGKTTPFGPNQGTLLDTANKMFSDSKLLTAFEEEILDVTFTRMLKNKPLRKNRI